MTVQLSSRLPRPIARPTLDDIHWYQTTHFSLNGMEFGNRVISGAELVGRSLLHTNCAMDNASKRDRTQMCAWYRRFLDHSKTRPGTPDITYSRSLDLHTWLTKNSETLCRRNTSSDARLNTNRLLRWLHQRWWNRANPRNRGKPNDLGAVHSATSGA